MSEVSLRGESRGDGVHAVFSAVDTLRVVTPGTSLGGVPREQKILKGHPPRAMYRQVYWYQKKLQLGGGLLLLPKTACMHTIPETLNPEI